jgi:hypothetical protein
MTKVGVGAKEKRRDRYPGAPFMRSMSGVFLFKFSSFHFPISMCFSHFQRVNQPLQRVGIPAHQ